MCDAVPTARRLLTTPVAGALWVAFSLAGCGDDGNDAAYQVRRAAERSAELRSSTTTVPSTDSPASESSTEPVPATTEPAVEPTGVVVPVVALDNSFRPQVVEISVGDEVLWENRGLNEHNVLYVEGDDWGIEVDGFQPGDVYAHVFTEPGEYRYYCSIHGSTEVGMVGTVVVTG